MGIGGLPEMSSFLGWNFKLSHVLDVKLTVKWHGQIKLLPYLSTVQVHSLSDFNTRTVRQATTQGTTQGTTPSRRLG